MATRSSKYIQTLTVSLWGLDIGTLQWDQRTQSSLFWFSPDYFASGYDIAPIAHDKALQSPAIAIPGIKEPKIYQGLPSFLADSLPDRWGNAVFDAWFKEEGLHEKDKTPLTKLSFIGKRAMGALVFYAQFTTEPKGKHVINVCLGTACYVKGAQQLIDRVEKLTGAAVNRTSPDGLFSLDATRCLGACGLAPVCIIDGKYYGNALVNNDFTNEIRRIVREEKKAGAKA